jgi:hypothetical protein
MKRSHVAVAGMMLGGALAFTGPPARAADKPAGQPSESAGSTDKMQNEGAPSGSEETGTAKRKSVVHSVAEQTAVTATIESIDQKSRKLTLKDADGDRVSVQVPKDVQGFGKLKKGEAVDITYTEAAAITVLPPGTEAPATQEHVVGTHDIGNGVMAREITTSATLTNVDTKKNRVTYKTPDGKTSTIKVENPAVQERLKNVKPGDVVQLTYSEAVATAVKPHEQGQTP